MSLTVEKVLAIAATQVGIHDEGGNDAGPVYKYQAAIGNPEGTAYCAAFLYWCMQQAGVELWPRDGYVPNLENWARDKGIYTQGPARRGDVMVLIGDDGVGYHVGFVTEASGAYVSTIEANSSDPSGANPKGVWRHTRAASACKFIRWDSLHDPGPTAAPGYVKLYPRDDGTFSLVLGAPLPSGLYRLAKQP